MTAYLTLYAHNEDQDSGDGQIHWPGTTAGIGNVPPSQLVISGGELVLLNKGYNTTYTSEDGTKTITFGSYLNGTTVSGPGNGGSFALDGTHTGYFDGPWAVIPANVADLRDHGFTDIAIFADVDWYSVLRPDGTTSFPVYARNGPQLITQQDIADYAITNNQLHSSMAESGHLSGATAVIWGNDTGSPPQHPLWFSAQNAYDWFEFKTKDGRGDSQNVSNWLGLDGHDGSFLLSTAQLATMAGGSVGHILGPYITSIGANGPTIAAWPALVSGAYTPGTSAHPGSPANSIISFCTLFPGGPGLVSVGAGGSLPLSSYFTIRYSYYQIIAVAGVTNGAASSYTQGVETPLSSPLMIQSLAAGSKITFSVPTPPTGWGVRIYAQGGGPADFRKGISYYQQLSGANYVISGGNYVLSSLNLSTYNPTSGFNAWPSGTKLGTDANAIAAFLMPFAHVGGAPDQNSGNYAVTPYNGTIDTQSGTTVGTLGLTPKHFFTTNAYSANQVLGQDGSGNLSWVTPGGSTSTGGGGISVDTYDPQTLYAGPITNPVLWVWTYTFTGNGTGATTALIPPGNGQFKFPTRANVVGMMPLNAASAQRLCYWRRNPLPPFGSFVFSPYYGAWTAGVVYSFIITVIGD